DLVRKVCKFLPRRPTVRDHALCVGGLRAGLLAEISAVGGAGGADLLAQPKRFDRAVDEIDIDQVYVDDFIVFVGCLANRLEPGLSLLIAGKLSADDRFGPTMVGRIPDSFAVGQPVGGKDLHSAASLGAATAASARSCTASGADLLKLAPATASPIIVM